MIFDLIIFDDNHVHMVKISKFPQGMNKQQLTVPESGINYLFKFRKTLTGPLCARWINSSTLIFFFLGLQFWPKGVGIANRRKLKTCVYLRHRLATTCSHFLWFAPNKLASRRKFFPDWSPDTSLLYNRRTAVLKWLFWQHAVRSSNAILCVS